MKTKKWVLLFIAVSLLLAASRAEAGSFAKFSWRAAGGPGTLYDIIAITNPELYELTVFTLGTKEGPNLPPAKGGGVVVVDITDRSSHQLVELFRDSQRFNGRRYRLLVERMPTLLRQDLYYRGFLTTKWAEIRNYIWDKDKQQTLAGKNWTWVVDPDVRNIENCKNNCDYQACLDANGGDPWDITDYCDCEEYMGRTFCHEKNRYTYSDVYDH